MVIMASPRSDSISSPKKGGGWKQGGKLASGKAPARGAPNLLPPPKYELREDWPVDGPIDMAQVRSCAAPLPAPQPLRLIARLACSTTCPTAPPRSSGGTTTRTSRRRAGRR